MDENISENDIESLPYIEEMSKELPTEQPLPEGRRIFDVNFLVKQMQSFGQHGSNKFHCTSKNMKFVKEVRRGFEVELHFKCNFCNSMEIIRSEQPESDQSTTNEAMVIY